MRVPPTAPRAARLEPEAADQLRTAVARRWPEEAVLALGGERDGAIVVIRACAELPNSAGADGRFAVDAPAFASAEALLREAGSGFLGFAHSHPDGIANPSAADRAAAWPHTVQIVAATRGRELQELGAYWVAHGGFERLPLDRAGVAT